MPTGWNNRELSCRTVQNFGQYSLFPTVLCLIEYGVVIIGIGVYKLCLENVRTRLRLYLLRNALCVAALYQHKAVICGNYRLIRLCGI